MNLEQFTAEAKRLSRKSRILRFDGQGEPVAYWHGQHGDEPWISVRYAKSWFTVYLETISSGHTQRSELPVKSSQPLFGKLAESLPPIDAVFLLGSPRVESYLHKHGWDRGVAFNGNFPDDIPFHYEKIYQANCPI